RWFLSSRPDWLSGFCNEFFKVCQVILNLKVGAHKTYCGVVWRVFVLVILRASNPQHMRDVFSPIITADKSCPQRLNLYGPRTVFFRCDSKGFLQNPVHVVPAPPNR